MTQLPYSDWLVSLKVGDKVNAHYDGKAGRGCPGEVIGTGSVIRVRFPAFGYPIKMPKIVEVDFNPTTGEGYDNSEDSLMEMIGVSDSGDYYRLGPIQQM